MIDNTRYLCQLCDPPRLLSLSNKAAHIHKVHGIPRVGQGKNSEQFYKAELANKNNNKILPVSPALPDSTNVAPADLPNSVNKKPDATSDDLANISRSLSLIVDSLKKLESQSHNLSNIHPPSVLLPNQLSEDVRRYNTWRKIKREVWSTSMLNGLREATIKQYLHVYSKLEKAGFKTDDLSNRHGYKKIVKWVLSLTLSSKNVYLSAIRKAAQVCFPGAPVSFAKIKVNPSKKKWPAFDEIIVKIQKMIDDKEINLALTSIFLLITGLRIHEALKLKLVDFGDKLFITDFVQEKSEKARPFVIITRQFFGWASRFNWTKIPWKHSYLAEKLKTYSLCCHSFRHAFITKRTKFVNDALNSTSQAIGHSSAKITKIYLIPDLAEEMKIIEKTFTLTLNF